MPIKVKKPCPICKNEEAVYYAFSGCRACLKCQRTEFFRGNGEDGVYGDIIRRWNAEEDRAEERALRKREEEIVKKYQMRLL